MKVAFDPGKDAINREKHGLSLEAAADMDLLKSVIIEDVRRDYGERRFNAYGQIDGRLHVLWFTRRGNLLRAIGLQRPMDEKENVMTKRREKPSHISQEDWDALDVPEMSDADFARAVPFDEAFPDLARSLKRQGGRPRLSHPKVKVAWRLSAYVVEHVKAIGKGYNGRVDAILRDAIAKGVL